MKLHLLIVIAPIVFATIEASAQTYGADANCAVLRALPAPRPSEEFVTRAAEGVRAQLARHYANDAGEVNRRIASVTAADRDAALKATTNVCAHGDDTASALEIFQTFVVQRVITRQ
jgi:hypothetical protein